MIGAQAVRERRHRAPQRRPRAGGVGQREARPREHDERLPDVGARAVVLMQRATQPDGASRERVRRARVVDDERGAGRAERDVVPQGQVRAVVRVVVVGERGHVVPVCARRVAGRLRDPCLERPPQGALQGYRLPLEAPQRDARLRGPAGLRQRRDEATLERAPQPVVVARPFRRRDRADVRRRRGVGVPEGERHVADVV
jgi:hypothetical protein